MKLKRRILLSCAGVLFIVMFLLEIFHKQIFVCEIYGENLYSTVTRFLGGFACMIFVYLFTSSKILSPKTTMGAFLVFLPCMAVAINNFPFITYFSGEAYIDSEPTYVLLYAMLCLGVGFFEEMAFRGCIFSVILSRRKKRRIDVFWSIVISSAVFGAVHLVNVFSGGSVGAVILQVGYSFLIGGMCSVILIKTQNIWYCVVLHAVYNFSGGVVPECGGGTIWSTPTVILTTVVAIIVAGYVIWQLVRITPTDIALFLNEDREEVKNNKNDTVSE